jgi:hypothetical protein
LNALSIALPKFHKMDWERYNIEGLKSRFLFKFLSERFLTKFLDTGNLWFARSDTFGDKMECVMIDDLKKDIAPDFDKIEARKRRHLISCFHEGNKETLAFWDTYAEHQEDRRKFALRFDRERLTEIIEDKIASVGLPGIKNLVHGRVKYKNLIGVSKNQLDGSRVKHPAFRKEYAFAYEKEYRFDILMKRESEKNGYNYNLGDIENIPFKILVNPLLEDADYAKCLRAIKSKGFKNNFMPSVLTGWLKPKLWQQIIPKSVTK